MRAITRKELAEFRRNPALLASMAVLPLVFMVEPLVAVIKLSESASGALAREHVLLYMLGIPLLVPVMLAAHAIAGERQQATLEPALTTPIRSEELLLGKALAAFGPSLVIAYAVYILYLILVTLLAQPGIASSLIRAPDLIAQLLFTPLLAVWSIWVGIAVSVRASDTRIAQQLGLLASLPAIALVVLVALSVITPTLGLALAAAALLLMFDVIGWRVIARLFNSERLITGSG